MSEQVSIVGAAKICAAVGQNRKNITRLVRDMGLPAFRINGKGNWIALPDELSGWLRKQRDAALGGSHADRA